MAVPGPDADGSRQQQQKCCLGALYFSHALNGKGKSPVCAGVRQTLGSAQDSTTLQAETVPPGHFRYVCVGYSMYNETRLKQRQVKGENEDEVELPYCEGLEVISAAALQRKPVLLEEGGAQAVAGNNASSSERAVPLHQRERRSFVSQPLGNGMRLDEFPERFARSARKILDRCSSNAAAIGLTAKRAADRVQEGLWGRSRDT